MEVCENFIHWMNNTICRTSAMGKTKTIYLWLLFLFFLLLFLLSAKNKSVHQLTRRRGYGAKLSKTDWCKARVYSKQAILTVQVGWHASPRSECTHYFYPRGRTDLHWNLLRWPFEASPADLLLSRYLTAILLMTPDQGRKCNNTSCWYTANETVDKWQWSQGSLWL